MSFQLMDRNHQMLLNVGPSSDFVASNDVFDFAKIPKRLHRLTETGRPFVWTAKC